MSDLTKNFSRHEFACKCGCGRDDISLELVAVLQELREALGAPLTITSGVRCMAHNAAVGAKPSSAHVKGLAADIACSDSRTRMLLVSLALHAGIGRVGIARTFVHLDLDKTLPQEVLWLY